MIVVGFISNYNSLSLSPTANISCMAAAEIYHGIKKLNVLSKVLYIGAHPDDENNKLITFLSHEKQAEVAYLSLTRGEGGQNYIGAEANTDLGVLREQELLAARRIDGGKQYFTRAKDFGFSKSTQETAAIWGEEDILADIVWVIRQFQPDILINRFPDHIKDKHAHHTVSAQLSKQAFMLAADPNYYTGQAPWRSKRLLWNVYAESGVKDIGGLVTHKQSYIGLPIASHKQLLGKSYAELAADSRNQHRCQALQAKAEAGVSVEYFEHVAGARATTDIFDGLQTDWSRLANSEAVAQQIQQLIRQGSQASIEAYIPALVSLLKEVRKLEDSAWKQVKEQEIQQLLIKSLGIEIHAGIRKAIVSPGERVTLQVNIFNKANQAVYLRGISATQFNMEAFDSLGEQTQRIAANDYFHLSNDITIHKNAEFSLASWLKAEELNIAEHPKEHKGHYAVANSAQACLSQDQDATKLSLHFDILGQDLSIDTAVYKLKSMNMPNKDLVYSSKDIVHIGPPVSIAFEQQQLLVRQGLMQEVKLTLRSHQHQQAGRISLNLPTGWKLYPASRDFNFQQAGQEEIFTFQLYVPQGDDQLHTLSAAVQIGEKTYTQGMRKVAYAHIKAQTYFPSAKLLVTATSLQNKARKIAYIKGTKDDMDKALAQFVEEVHVLSPGELSIEKLKGYDALVLGKRLYNIASNLGSYHQIIQNYVQQGGVVITQYNTNYDLAATEVGAYPLSLTANRITDEHSPISFLEPEARVLNFPNQISSADFEGWKQERALFLPAAWDNAFMPILRTHDLQEEAQDGSLLVRADGKGYYVYSSLSFHRQLPLGVAGAYRLFANLLSLACA